MSEKLEFSIIGKIYTDFPDKFGLPRQSGMVPSLRGKIIFEPEYRNYSAVRELNGFSHIWVIWNFSKSEKKDWSATVRPPRLGGNQRVGVFATRSPYRPNPIGMSALKLEGVENHSEYGPVIYVSGIDIADGTPILDIKPYLSFADSFPDATDGFADKVKENLLKVDIPKELTKDLSAETVNSLYGILAGDPRPHYHKNPERVYGFSFAGVEVKFVVEDNVLTVIEIIK